MLNRKQVNQVIGTTHQPMFEKLEGRQMMTATMAHVEMTSEQTSVPAIVMCAQPAAKLVAKVAVKVSALPAYIPATSGVKGKNVVGEWTGTMQLDGSKTASAFSIKFAFQRGVAASGTFNLGATMSNQAVTSTMVFDLHNNFRAMVATPKLAAGFTGAISSNGKMLTGRFSFNSATGWKTGVFTLTRGA